jgi:hypothetical protein
MQPLVPATAGVHAAAGRYAGCAGRATGLERQVIDVWTKQLPGNKTVTFKIEGDRKSGFVYSAKMEGRDIREITGFLEELTRERVEAMFANYVAGK